MSTEKNNSISVIDGDEHLHIPDNDQSLIAVNNFKLYIEDDDVGDFTPDIKVTVDNPQRHAETFETYISYRITITFCRSESTINDYVIRRRYNDFLWLKTKLVENYPARLIPPLPSKHTFLGQLDRYAKDFIVFRMVMLRRFLNRIIKHPILSYSEHLKVFLKADVTELTSQQRSNTSGLLLRVSEGLCNLTMMYNMKEKYADFEEIKHYVTCLHEKLLALEKIFSRMLKERKELTKNMNRFALEFENWATSEVILSLLLSSVARAVSSVASVHDTFLANPLEYFIVQPIREYILYVESVKDALMRRDNVQIQYELAVEELHKKCDQLSTNQSWFRNTTIKESSVDSKKNYGFVENSKPPVTCSAEDSHDKLYIANEDLRSDLDRWSLEKNNDVKRILLALSNHYINYYQKSLNIWEESLRKIAAPLNKEC